MRQLFSTGELESIIKNTGLKYKISGNWIMMKCPFHIESNPSFGINMFSGSYHCFACSSKGNWENLSDKLKIDQLIDSIEYTGFDLLRNIIDEKIKSFGKIVEDFNKIKIGDKYYDYICRIRGLSSNIIKEFNIGYIINNKHYENRVVVPVYDENYKLLWYEGRFLGKNKTKYYRPLNTKSKNTVFNLNKCDDDYIIITEGIFGAIKIWDLGFYSGCLFGASITEEQINKLIRYKKVFFIFDSDKAGHDAIIKSKKLLFNTGFDSYIVNIKRNDDVDFLSKERLLKYLKKSVLIRR